VYALLLGGLCIGFAPVLVRLADVGPVASAFWRLALAAPLLWLLYWRCARHAAIRAPDAELRLATPRNVGWWSQALLLSGLFFAADLGTWHFSIRDTTVANATLLANCAPLLVTLYALLVERRTPPRLYFVALTLALGGAFVLVSPNFDAGSQQLRGDALGLLAAVFYSGYMLAVKRASM
jgi:drug/metabolite transporter (DMT)-like permease